MAEKRAQCKNCRGWVVLLPVRGRGLYKPREFQVFDPYFSLSSSFFPLDFSFLMDKVFAALLGRSHSERSIGAEVCTCG